MDGLLRISDLNAKSQAACPRSTSRVIVDEQSWESINTSSVPPSPPRRENPSSAGKGMTTSYIGQLSVHSKRYESTGTPPKDIPDPSLGLDLRFEQTYLKSIAPHVRLTTPASDENEKRRDLVHNQDRQLDIKWGMVIWITTRDQVFAPMFQGMIWSVPSLPRPRSFKFDVSVSLVTVVICRGVMSPWVQYFRRRSAPSSKNGQPTRTGAGIAKLKSWLSSIIPPTPTASFRTK